jgi:hypothetical protein
MTAAVAVVAFTVWVRRATITTSREGRQILNSVVMRLLGALRPYGQSLGVGQIGDRHDNSFPH